MKSKKITFDFSDMGDLIELLRIESARQGTTQKALVVAALKAYFSNGHENKLILQAAEQSFTEWHSKEDEVYDKL